MITQNGAQFESKSSTLIVRPANDAFANRMPIQGMRAVVRGGNAPASRETGEPVHAACASGKSVWYTWQAPATGRAEILARGLSFCPVVSVYTGNSLSNLELIATGLVTNTPPAISQVSFVARRGTNYEVAIDTAGAEGGLFTLELREQAAQKLFGLQSEGRPNLIWSSWAFPERG